MVEQYTAAGIRYYVNPRTQETRWSPPKNRERRRSSDAQGGTTAAGSNAQGALLLGSDVDGGIGEAKETVGLPSGWEKRTTPSGRDYYLNHDLRWEGGRGLG